MFTFTKKFWHNSKSQRGTLLLANFVNFIILALIASLIAVPFLVLLQSFYMSAMMGQIDINSIIFLVIAFIVLGSLLFIFLMYPLLTGSIRTFYNVLQSEKRLKITDIFKTFTGGRWLKAVIIGVFVLLTIFLIIVANGLFEQLLNIITEKIISTLDISDPNFTLIMIVKLIISLLLSIVPLFGFIFIINMTTAFVEDPQRKIGEIIKLGWKTIFNKQKTFLKFFIGIIIINLLVLLLSIPTQILQRFLIEQLSYDMIQFVKGVISIIFALIRFIFYFVIAGTAVQYFMNFGKKEA